MFFDNDDEETYPYREDLGRLGSSYDKYLDRYLEDRLMDKYYSSQFYFDKKEKKRVVQEENDFVNSAIGLAEVMIQMSIPKDIVGEICTFFQVANKKEAILRKTGKQIYDKMDRMLQIKKRLKKCRNIDDYEEKYTNTLHTDEEHDYIKNYFGFSVWNYCCIL